MLRLLVGLALGFGFLGFATRSHADDAGLQRQSQAELVQLGAPQSVPGH